MFSPTKLKDKLNALKTWISTTFVTNTDSRLSDARTPVAHTHTTNDIKMQSDQTVTLTTELGSIWKYAKKNRKLAKAAL